jgi:hypothetical protein
MTAAVQTAKMHIDKGVELLYNEDRSLVYKENAPAATAEFTQGLDVLLAHEAKNPRLYAIPAITAGIVELRARAYKERATSHIIAGDQALYVKDWEKVLETVEDLKPKLKAALADSRIDPQWRGNLKKVQANALALEGNANGALGLHYRITGDKATSDTYLKRALEILPADDPSREKITRILEMPEAKK